MFIWRLDGLAPKSLTRVRAPFAVAQIAAMLPRTAVEKYILSAVWDRKKMVFCELLPSYRPAILVDRSSLARNVVRSTP
jgi:hypothetical protein